MALSVNVRPRAVPSCALPLALAAVLLGGCGSKSPTAPPAPLPPLSRIVIALAGDTLVARDTLAVGQHVNFNATVYDTGNAVVATAVSWQSTATGVVTVTSAGAVAAVGEGVATVIAQVAGVRDSVGFLVLPAAGGWIVQTTNSSRTLNGVYVQPDGRTGVAVGDGGELLRTTNAGATWTRIASNTLFNLNAAWFTTATEGWVVGGNGTILKTTDAGVSWNPVTSFTGDALFDVWFATPDTGWAVGANGTILRTFDRGASWQKQNPTAFALRSVAFAGTRRGWAVGDNGTIVGTTDRGLTWNVVNPAVTGLALRAVARLGVLEAWAAGAAGAAPRTVDAGGGVPGWELRNAGASNSLHGLWFADASTGWACGENGTGIVLRTDDAGLAWTPQTVPSGTTLRDVFFLDELRGWVVGENGRVLHTGTGGRP